jgi:hypothetical protein
MASPTPRSRNLARPGSILDSNETSASFLQESTREDGFASPSKLTWLGEVTEFFAVHQPSWFAAGPDRVVPPLVSVYLGGEMSDWIRTMLQKRRTPTDLAELLVGWLEAGFGIPLETGPVRDQAFVEWILRGADARLEDASLARLTRELLEARPPAAATELRALRRMLDKWSLDLARVSAEPPLI